MARLRIIVTGFIGLYPTGGVTWDYIQYPVGLQLLGHDVYYLEDTMQYSTFQAPGQEWNDASESVRYLKEVMESFGLGDRWAYRDIGSGKCFGMTEQQLEQLCSTADIFLNISASAVLRHEYFKIPNRVLVDSDPMFTQVQDWNDDFPEESYTEIRRRYSWYSHFFTFGENIGATDCMIPTYGLKWQTTRQPVCINFWNVAEMCRKIRPLFTTVMNWSARSDMVYNRQTWGQKNIEFKNIVGVPARCSNADFEIALAAPKAYKQEVQQENFSSFGWTMRKPSDVVSSADDYRNYISCSTAEFSVAKNAYVKSVSGWFSCRSACYLAAGRPVITQETGWSKYIPQGNGLFSFSDMDSAVQAVSRVVAAPEIHAKAAKDLANEYFDSRKVLAGLLEHIN